LNEGAACGAALREPDGRNARQAPSH